MYESENDPPDRQEAGKTHEGAEPTTVCFDYIKSSFFRIIHVDGVVGGLTPRLDIQMNFWSERFPIPKQVVHRREPDGGLGEEILAERLTRDAIIREVEAGIVLDFYTAKAIRDWLNKRIEEVEKILAAQGQKDQAKP